MLIMRIRLGFRHCCLYSSYDPRHVLIDPSQIGSSIQIFLFVLPFLVCLAWGLDKDLTLSFDVFETVVGTCFTTPAGTNAYSALVTLAIIVVSYAIADGRTNWLEGFVLMVLYVIIGMYLFLPLGSS